MIAVIIKIALGSGMLAVAIATYYAIGLATEKGNMNLVTIQMDDNDEGIINE